MSDITTLMMAASGAGGAEETDPNFNQTVLLLHGDGTNGAQNNTFLDSSTNNFTITRNGNTTQGTFSPFSNANGEWSNYFDGSGDYINCDQALDGLTNASDPFTVECWFYPTTKAPSGSFNAIIGINQSGGATNELILSIDVNGELSIHYAGSYRGVFGTINVNAWNHVAGVFDGTDYKVYLNGALVYTLSSTSPAVALSTCIFHLGTELDSGSVFGNYFEGYISNARVTESAVYTSAFTPSTTPLTAISGTSLLTCQSNRFVDNSASPKTITVAGNTSVQPFSPFAPSAAYSASVNGGSGYFDGTGDYLRANNASLGVSTQNFTAECWIYPTANMDTSDCFMWLMNSNQTNASGNTWAIRASSSNNINAFVVYGSTLVSVNSTTPVNINQWNHVAICRSGTTLYLGVNGAIYSLSIGAVTLNNQQYLHIGGAVGNGTPQYFFTGYISGARYEINAALYTSAYTVPTAPPSPTGSTFCAEFTNAGIFDNTGKNNLETVGNAQIDTTTVKYGTGSMEFDGTGDWLKVPNSPDLQLGTGDFTIEFWVYLASGDTGSARGLVAKGGASTGWLVSLDSSEKVVFTYTTSTITSSGAITTNAWNHIAVVREGTGSNETKIYIGGTNDGTGTVSTDFNQTEVMYIGANRAAGDPMKGYIDDLRITKGVARYTTTFTPPTAPFPDQ